MSERTPATDKGTADRIEADDGGYWVRLVTKQAIRREGVCMDNCLDRPGYGQHLAGDEDMASDALWSLRNADGLSSLLVEVNSLCEPDEETVLIENALGPKNSKPSGWSIRQLRHLVVAFNKAGVTFQIPEDVALVGEDGRTWRPDKAPQALKDAMEARQKAEAAEKARARGDSTLFIRNDPYVRFAAQSMIRSVIGDGPITPAADQSTNSPETRDAGADLIAAMQQGIITCYEHDERGFGEVTVRPPGRPDEMLTPNGDGTYALRTGNYTFPRVVPTGDVGIGRGDIDTITFRIAPERQERPVRVVRTLNGGTAKLVRYWTGAPEGQPAGELRSGMEFDQEGNPVAYHVAPVGDRAAIEANINGIEEALVGGYYVPADAAVNRLRSLYRELAQVDGRAGEAA